VGGLFGVISNEDCVPDLYYGTDYHSHPQFRSKFEDDLSRLSGTTGIGVISDYEDQPLIISSHHGTYAIVTVAKVGNLDALVQAALSKNGTHFSEMTGSEVNPTQLVAHLIDQGDTFVVWDAPPSQRGRRRERTPSRSRRARSPTSDTKRLDTWARERSCG
jgi:amidophosphoribosyltransferase